MGETVRSDDGIMVAPDVGERQRFEQRLGAQTDMLYFRQASGRMDMEEAVNSADGDNEGDMRKLGRYFDLFFEQGEFAIRSDVVQHLAPIILRYLQLTPELLSFYRGARHDLIGYLLAARKISSMEQFERDYEIAFLVFMCGEMADIELLCPHEDGRVNGEVFMAQQFVRARLVSPEGGTLTYNDVVERIRAAS